MDRRSPHAGAHGLRRLISACVISALAATTAITVEARRADPLACGVDLKLLVLSADGNEAVLPAITRTLDYLGTPYTLQIVSQHPGGISDSFLKSGCRGFYQGIIQTTASLAYWNGTSWGPALTPAETDSLIRYAAEFGVRQANWYSWPSPDNGLFFTATVDTNSAPLPVVFTDAGKSVFPYLSAVAAPAKGTASRYFPAAPPGLSIQLANVYLASAASDATTPLITDAAGDVLAATFNNSDGREVLTMTFDGNPNLTHSIALGYGVVNWVTRGTFIGARRIYMSPQVDDVLLDNDRWLPATPCGTPVDGTGNNVRMTGTDFTSTVVWQRARRSIPQTQDIRLTMAYNGFGAQKGEYPKDTLTPAVKSYQGDFFWVSHTFTHPMLDAPMDYYTALDELRKNQQTAKTLKFTLYSPTMLVTPNVSGLANAEAMRAAYTAGVRYIVSDTSVAGQDNPFPNIGIVNAVVPRIFEIPRRPTNLYYNVAAPEDWVAEYNCMYAGYWGRPLTYDEILADQSQMLTTFMIRGESDPWMFHQPNLVFYDKAHSLLTDLLDATLARYAALYNLPVLSPSMEEVGKAMQAKAAVRDANARAYRATDGSIVVTASAAATVPITGLATAGAEVYGGQPTTYVKVAAGKTVTVKPAAPKPAPQPIILNQTTLTQLITQLMALIQAR